MLGVGALASVAAAWHVFGVRDPPLRFVPLDGLDGWRRAETPGVTVSGGGAAGAVLAGIDDVRVTPLPSEALCPALYQTAASGVPVAVFSDFFCPNCRILDARLGRRSDLAITWHQLPLLGPNSERFARVLMAADAQGGYVAMRDALLSRPLRPSRRGFVEAAGFAGLDSAAFERALDAPATDRRLADTAAAAETLAIWGTPAFTIGRILVIGTVSDAQLDTLVAEARNTVCS